MARQTRKDDLATMLRLSRPEAHGDEARTASEIADWNAIWDYMDPKGVVLEDLTRREGPKAVGFMLSILMTTEMYQRHLASPTPGLLTRLRTMAEADQRTWATEEEIAQGNATDGLCMLVCYMGWEGDNYSQEPAPNVRASLATAFADRHAGNRLSMMFGELGGLTLFEVAAATGCVIVNNYEEWAVANNQLDNPRRPYLVAVSREAGLASGNFWPTRMFTYYPPKFHFTQSQRDILIYAREGYTDAEIADHLGSTPDAVKKRWAAIYDRVAEVFPDLLPESPTGGRGVEKRRALLAQLRERPEELRPYERRLATRR